MLPAICLLSGLLGSACTPTDGFEGPDLEDLYGDFAVLQPLTVTGDNADFSNNEIMQFSAEVSLQTDWRLTLTGQQSGAVKIREGNGQLINVIWNGSTTELPVFQQEPVQAVLNFPGHPDTLSTLVTVGGPKSNDGIVVANFNNGQLHPAWETFFQAGVIFAPANDHATGEGDYYLSMNGTVNWDWLIGQVEFPAIALHPPGPNVPPHYPLPPTPNGLFFNAMVYGDATRPNSLLKFEFREDDDFNGTYESNSEDRYDYEIPVDWDGWRLISIPYGSLSTPTDPQWGGANGNKLHNSNRIVSVRVLLLSDPSAGEALADIDYLIWTLNGPLTP